MTSGPRTPAWLDRRSLVAAMLLAALPTARRAGARSSAKNAAASMSWKRAVVEAERPRIVGGLARWMSAPIETVVDHRAERSPGDAHAYYSEGDYWWPDQSNPGGPYIRRDGHSNPSRFEAHRLALIGLSRTVPWLASARLLTGADAPLVRLQQHLDAWFVEPATRMAPHLEHAQAIIGRNAGRGIGIIDTLHLVEVARAAYRIDERDELRNASAIKAWFRAYLDWMLTSANGLDEQDELNNHATCYVLQVAAFAELLDDAERLDWCMARLRNILLSSQVEADGRQPLELSRTKPYSYTLFNAEAMATLTHLLHGQGRPAWDVATAAGGSVARAVRWLEPYIRDKSAWPFAADVEHFDDWPMRQMSLLFTALATGDQAMFKLWQGLPSDSEVPEVVRNTPIRQPVLWLV